MGAVGRVFSTMAATAATTASGAGAGVDADAGAAGSAMILSLISDVDGRSQIMSSVGARCSSIEAVPTAVTTAVVEVVTVVVVETAAVTIVVDSTAADTSFVFSPLKPMITPFSCAFSIILLYCLINLIDRSIILC